jgi:hypothetical protein
VRVLPPPPLMQWSCAHRWKTTTTRPGEDDIVRMRYLICRRCRLKVKTHERLAVPWDEADLVTQVKALLPEGQTVALRDKGITELPLARLNAQLAPHGYVIHASKGRDRTRLVACMDQDGRVTPYELFALWPLSPEASPRTNDTRDHGKNGPLVGQRDAEQPHERKC